MVISCEPQETQAQSTALNRLTSHVLQRGIGGPAPAADGHKKESKDAPRGSGFGIQIGKASAEECEGRGRGGRGQGAPHRGVSHRRVSSRAGDREVALIISGRQRGVRLGKSARQGVSGALVSSPCAPLLLLSTSSSALVTAARQRATHVGCVLPLRRRRRNSMLTKPELGMPGVSNTAPTGYVQLVQGNPRDPEPETSSPPHDQPFVIQVTCRL